MKRVVLSIMMVVLIISTVAFRIEFVEANGINYISGDGTIFPPDLPITRAGNYYTLTGDIILSVEDNWGNALQIFRSDIVLDGAGYIIQNDYLYPS